ncbi:hypothetical protein D3C76_1546130 [compost metagenome]
MISIAAIGLIGISSGVASGAAFFFFRESVGLAITSFHTSLLGLHGYGQQALQLQQLSLSA